MPRIPPEEVLIGNLDLTKEPVKVKRKVILTWKKNGKKENIETFSDSNCKLRFRRK